MRVLMTGATGLIGKEIGKVLAEKGHQIFVLSRDVQKAKQQLAFPCEVIQADIGAGVVKDPRMKDIEAVINLMGEPIVSGRWTEEKKKKIYNSRIEGTRHLVESLPENLKVFVSSSAMGIYGDSGDAIQIEDSEPAQDFLAKVCLDWEAAAHKAPGRVVCIRTGIVLAEQGGALEQMLFPFKAGVGGRVGSGKQWMSWIHLKDIVGLFVFALENNKVQGALNASAPVPVTNQEFSDELAKALGKRMGPPVPTLALKALFGEAAVTILASTKMASLKAQDLGYQFHFGQLAPALSEICAAFKEGEEVFHAEQFVPYPPEKLFEFFKSAHNLEEITPPTLSFKIENISTKDIEQGTKIDYKLKIHGVPARWKTEIDEWKPPFKFVDNQLEGPYSLWHHTHEFRPFCGGTLMVDRVRYKLPLGYMGWLMAHHFVRKDIENIFKFRRGFISNLQESRL